MSDKVTDQLLLLLLGAALIQSLFIGLSLLFKPGENKRSARFLMFILLIASFDLLEAYNYFIYDFLPSLPDYSDYFVLFYGPLIYLYTKSLIVPRKKGTYHILINSFLTVFWIILINKGLIIIYYALYAQIISYTLLSIAAVIKMKLKEKNTERRILIVFLTLFLSMIITAIVFSLLEMNARYSPLTFVILVSLFLFTVYFLSYCTLNRFLFPFVSPLPEPENIKYEKYREGTAAEKENLQKLSAYMTKSKAYLNPQFSLSELGKETGFSQHYLSMLFNCELKQNFYYYINTYRIEYIEEKLKTDRDKSILEIAYEGGFHSKSTFNKVFKEHTGCTPSEYRKKESIS